MIGTVPAGSRSCTPFVLDGGNRAIHHWPSNFFIEPDGTHVEGEFQAAKHEGHPWRQRILLRHRSPGKAKRLARTWKLTPVELKAWDARKDQVMLDLIRKKVDDWPHLAQQLRFTGDGELVEDNWWHDNYWGDCHCFKCFRIGRNQLGKIWMQVREEIS